MAIAHLLALNENAAFGLLGEEASYTPAGGTAVTVRVMPTQPDLVVGMGETQVHTASTVFRLRAAELQSLGITPAAGDRITYAEAVYTVSSPPTRDERRRLWTVETTPGVS